MRLLIVNWQDRLNPQAGGAEAHLHEIFSRLAARGHEVTMLVSGWPGAPDTELVDGIEVHRIARRYTFSARVRTHYLRHLADRPFDLVIEALNKVPVFTPVWSGRRCVLVVHHLFGATAFREASMPLAAATWLLERPISRVYKGVPVEAISVSTADDLVARGLRRQDIQVIYPGVDLEFFTPDEAVERPSTPTFLYLGRLKRYKGIHLILRALARVKRNGVECRLVVAGRGEYLDALRKLASRLEIEHLVDFVGFVSEARKRDLMRSAWANVFTSPKEGWGITNLEAAACGTPTIASDSPGLRESVRHDVTGLLVPHGDVRALASAMEALARDPARVERLGVQANLFAAEFGWDRAADETEEHLRDVLRRDTGAST